MNIEQLRKELEVDEGVKYEIYNDHLGYPTFGIGHLVRDNDPENGEPVGTPVSEDRVIEAFNEDVETVLSDCAILYDDFDELPEEAIETFLASDGFELFKEVGADPTSIDDERRGEFFKIIDEQLGNMPDSSISAFVESGEFAIYKQISEMYT